MLVKGENLTKEQITEVKSAFIYRWTFDNPQRESAWRGLEGQPTIPLISDEDWIREQAFYITNSGRLDGRYNFCEPVWMADTENN